MIIKKLPEDVIVRIAAGEVITSPYNIVKELLENSLDAKASFISIEVNTNNFEFTIRDNGSGIRTEDFEFLCQNHYTSKLDSLESFKTQFTGISTFGFRGEALHSISMCSKVIVTSKSTRECENSNIGYIAEYCTGNLIGLKECAVDDKGTAIEVKDVFYNNSIRRNNFYKNKLIFNQILELVKSYGILYNSIEYKVDGKSIIKLNKTNRLINSGDGFEGNKTDDIILNRSKYIYSNFLLSLIKYESIKSVNTLRFNAIFTDRFASLKNKLIIVFINGRLVKNQRLLNLIVQIYKKSTKQCNPFVFVEINSKCVDVNVHPAKTEVFIEETEIFDEIANAISCELNTSFMAMSLEIPNENNENTHKTTINTNLECSINDASDLQSDTHPVQELPSLSEFFKSRAQYTHNPYNSFDVTSSPYKVYLQGKTRRLEEYSQIKKVPQKRWSLTSLACLKNELQEIDPDFFSQSVFVGQFNGVFFIQHQSNLIKINKAAFLFEVFYQKFIADFGNFECTETLNSISIEIPESLHELLREYFSMIIENSVITAMPKVFDITIDFKPEYFTDFNIQKLDEMGTLKQICEKLAGVYSNTEIDYKLFNKIKLEVITTEFVIKSMSLLVDLKELYKGFDRC